MRDARCFGPDTSHFVPERFVGDSPQAELARRSFAAFGANSRGCLGAGLALTYLRAALCTILQRYKVCLVDPHAEVRSTSETGVCCPVERPRFRFVPHRKEDFNVDGVGAV
jgi:cytochrome P450